MKTISLPKNAFNRVRAAGQSYFTFDGADAYAIVPSTCPHRGGPLHLGSLSACKARLVCPWHDQQYPTNFLVRQGLPVIVRRQQVTFVVDDDAPLVWKEFLPHLHSASS